MKLYPPSIVIVSSLIGHHVKILHQIVLLASLASIVVIEADECLTLLKRWYEMYRLTAIEDAETVNFTGTTAEYSHDVNAEQWIVRNLLQKVKHDKCSDSVEKVMMLKD